MKEINNYKKVFEFFGSFTNLEKDTFKVNKETFQLERLSAILDYFGNPHLSYKTIHIDGSKGKGSVAMYLSQIISSHNFKTGLYQSPHISSYLERYQINNHFVDETTLINCANRIINSLSDIISLGFGYPTTFELQTLLAFIIFESTKCEYGIIETGFGGMLDATNVIKPVSIIITEIELEHKGVIGNSKKEIANSISNIVKENSKVFISKQDIYVQEIFEHKCKQTDSKLYKATDEISISKYEANFKGIKIFADIQKTRFNYNISQYGLFQIWNSSLAILCAKNTIDGFDKKLIENVLYKTSIPGRMELINTTPQILIDGAHTVNSMKALLESIKLHGMKTEVLVIGIAYDKEISEIIKVLNNNFKSIIVTNAGGFKKSEPEKLFMGFKKHNSNVYLVKEHKSAFSKALEISKDSLEILITGSFQLISSAKLYFK